MKNDSFISLNIVNSNEILYKIFPIVFYWNGVNDVVNDLLNNKDFYNIISKYINSKYYDTVKICMTYVNSENYNEREILIQELYPLYVVNDNIYNELITDIFYDIYEKIFKKEYEIPIENFGFKNIISDIYEDIIKKMSDKITKETFFNYILSQLDERTKLTFQNKEYLVKYIKDILKES